MKNDRTTKSCSAILLISCPDRKGLVAAITEFISSNNGNIVHLDQHVDFQQNVFFSRFEWDLEGFNIPRENIAAAFSSLAEAYNMQWELHFSDYLPRMAVFVSKQTHCLYDVLSRYRSGEWNVEIPFIISNHEEAQSIAYKFGINYHVFPIEPSNKHEQEAKQLKMLREANIDLIVLCRYMQILSEDFVKEFPNRIINIHHSFLPAFPGAKPYHSAYSRGVKIIGATSHYVTAELDAGPIIEQDIIRVSHKNSIQDFIRKGKDLEKIVLSRAIWYHLSNKILVYNNKTVIFE
jgi:formyltetrahydrofolate deformylase